MYSEEISCSFEQACSTLRNDKSDHFDWTRHSGETPSSDTGPVADHTVSNSAGRYLTSHKIASNEIPPLFYLFCVLCHNNNNNNNNNNNDNDNNNINIINNNNLSQPETISPLLTDSFR